MIDAGRQTALRGLELTVVRRLDGILQGDYRGLLPGHGFDHAEARPYQPGDDVRRIDWNVTARERMSLMSATPSPIVSSRRRSSSI